MTSQPQKYFAIHPDHFRELGTQQLREHFLLENLFIDDTIQLRYTHYDRMIVGGAKPKLKALRLETVDALKAAYFLERRELGIINVGGSGMIIIDGQSISIENKEALYIGRRTKEVMFASKPGQQALFYFNSCPAHAVYPVKKISLDEAETVEIGYSINANQRTIRKLLVQSKVQSCQLQMGLTELKEGSVWNTMPAHTHDRRMEVYFYFNLPEGNAVCHFIGDPKETRHIWMKNNEAVLSPPWSIHAGVATAAYSFVWGMAGENLDYTDMDGVKLNELR